MVDATVPFLNLKSLNKAHQTEFLNELQSILDSGMYIHGPKLAVFEQQFAKYCGSDSALGVANGLDALVLALRAADIGPGDEVLVPAQTFIATWLAVSAVGATLVPIDVSIEDCNLNPDLVAAKLSKKTKALIGVHLFGRLCEVQKITKLCAENKILFIEDAAQAHGAEHSGKRAGTFGHMGCFSFYPGKNLGALGDAGALTTSDSTYTKKVRLLRNYGSEKKYHHEVIGTNSRLDEIQAAFLSVKLKTLDSENQRRREIAQAYQEQFANLPLATLPKSTGLENVWHLFPVRHPEREKLQSYLSSHQIQTLIHYPFAPFQTGAYQGLWKDRDFPAATLWAKDCLSLPIDPLMSDEQVGRVIDQVKLFFKTQA